MKHTLRNLTLALAAVALPAASHAGLVVTNGYSNPGPDGQAFLYEAKGKFTDRTAATWNVSASVGAWSYANLASSPNIGWGHTSAWYLVEIVEATNFTVNMTSSSTDARPGFVMYAGESVNDDPGSAHQYSNNGLNIATVNADWDFNGPGNTPGLTYVTHGLNSTGSTLTKTLFLNPGLYTIAMGNIANSGLSPSGKTYSIAFSVTGLNPQRSWREQYFGTINNTGNAADLATPNGDGIANLLKYGLCIVPGTSGASSLPQIFTATTVSDSRIALRFLRHPARTDINLIVEAQSGLGGTWTSIARSNAGAVFTGTGTASETSNPDGTRLVEVKDTVQITSGTPPRFLRVRVENVP